MIGLLGSLTTWYFWAYYAAGLLIMTCVLALHLRRVRMGNRGPWLLVAGGILGTVGSIVGGIQAGPLPPMTFSTGIMLVRACWVGGITLGVVAACLYLWSARGPRL